MKKLFLLSLFVLFANVVCVSQNINIYNSKVVINNGTPKVVVKKKPRNDIKTKDYNIEEYFNEDNHLVVKVNYYFKNSDSKYVIDPINKSVEYYQISLYDLEDYKFTLDENTLTFYSKYDAPISSNSLIERMAIRKVELFSPLGFNEDYQSPRPIRIEINLNQFKTDYNNAMVKFKEWKTIAEKEKIRNFKKTIFENEKYKFVFNNAYKSGQPKLNIDFKESSQNEMICVVMNNLEKFIAHAEKRLSLKLEKERKEQIKQNKIEALFN